MLICSPSHALHGGVETIINDLCGELPRRGWDALVALGKGARFNNVDAYRDVYPDLPIIEIDGTKGTRQSRVEALLKVIKATRPDVVLSARVFDAYEAIGLLKQSSASPRLAVAIRAYEPHYLHDARLYRNCIDLCVADGNLLTDTLIQFCGFCPKKVANVPGGVHAPKVVSRCRSSELIRIGYVGRLEQNQKRIFDLASLVRNLDTIGIHYTIDIVGTGPEEEGIKDKLSAWVSKGSVAFHGWQSHDALYDQFFPHMDCLVHFAHTEGVTMAPREAMAHGVVPVISEFTGLRAERQFIDGMNSLVFPVGDTEAAASRIQRLIVEPNLIERLSSNGICSQTGRYSFSGSMDEWASALNECLERAPEQGTLPKLNVLSDGRLAQMGLPPQVAQRIRDLLGRRHVHSDPGSEWPTRSGLMTEYDEREILQFASEYERKIEAVQIAAGVAVDC